MFMVPHGISEDKLICKLVKCFYFQFYRFSFKKRKRKKIKKNNNKNLKPLIVWKQMRKNLGKHKIIIIITEIKLFRLTEAIISYN